MADNETKPADGEQKARRRLNMTLDSYTMSSTPRNRQDRKQLRLTIGCSNGYPNVSVETDEVGEATLENGFMRVQSRLNAVNFNVLCSLIEFATTQEPGWKNGVECYHTWKNGRQHEEKQHINDVIVGVDNQGLVFISIIEAGRTTTKFAFGPTEWHNYKKENGDAWGQKELNHLCAKEWASGAKIAMNALIAADCMDNATQRAGLPSPSVKPQDGGGYQKKEWNNNGGGQGGYQKKPWQGNQNGGYQKKPWNGGGQGGGGGGYQNNGGGQGGYQKKQWNNGGQQGGQGGYQRKEWNNNGGGQGGFQKKQWDNGGQQNGQQGGYKKSEPNTEIDLGDFEE